MFKIRLNVHFNCLFMNNEHRHKVNTKEKASIKRLISFNIGINYSTITIAPYSAKTNTSP